MERVAFMALGCRVNRADLDTMAALVDGAFSVVPEGEPADFVVVNTCSITHDADSAARQAIRRAARENPAARIVVTGCYAELAPDVLAALPGVAAVLGIRQQTAIRDVLVRLGGEPVAPTAKGAPEVGVAWGPAPLEAYGHTRPFLKLQDGCDQRCSYCVVPLARGTSRSMPFDEALAQLARLGQRNAEVVLTGVHLGAWGRDLQPRRGLVELLREAVERRSVRRIRLSSIESGEFPTEALVDPAISAVLCDHFHLPLQSGSERILRRMGRGYGPDAFRRSVEEVAALAPGSCLGTDVMVGFPGETDDDFRETVRLLEHLPFAYLHVFPFSPRPGTRAAGLPDPVAGPVVRERARELVALGDRRWRAFLKGLAGHVLEVVVERVEGGLARGTSRRYATVRWPASDERRGQVVRVRVEASDGQECFGISARTFASRLPP
ncbi:MAG TPA: tRNA (N(6)-L-threonylcarbamoyladenosine(37)-C(2))-methylthiotransferase MtaB [Anaeromyxobacteraceae bacterium]|nr:tRNA (N(6)-L-threonylcarbamoyladenosine(37)-C(2))-methylthiotransferase MtaB [Anaeromyxobacteraceae bacterium]